MSVDWIRAYEDGVTPWDKGEAAPPLLEFLERHHLSGSVLVPGCGTGHDVRALARQAVQVLGLDIAPGAISTASAYTPVADESYAVGDFLNLPERLYGRFDWVVEHTCLCALAPEQRSAYALSVHRALKPGGYYLAIFYRTVSDYSGEGPPHPITEAQIEALFSDRFECIEGYIPTRSYESRPYGAEEVRLLRKLG